MKSGRIGKHRTALLKSFSWMNNYVNLHFQVSLWNFPKLSILKVFLLLHTTPNFTWFLGSRIFYVTLTKTPSYRGWSSTRFIVATTDGQFVKLDPKLTRVSLRRVSFEKLQTCSEWLNSSFSHFIHQITTPALLKADMKIKQRHFDARNFPRRCAVVL